MKVFLTIDEWYLVYGLSTENRPYLSQKEVDIPAELLEEWNKLEDLFENMQEKLSKLPFKKIPATR